MTRKDNTNNVAKKENNQQHGNDGIHDLSRETGTWGNTEKKRDAQKYLAADGRGERDES